VGAVIVQRRAQHRSWRPTTVPAQVRVALVGSAATSANASPHAVVTRWPQSRVPGDLRRRRWQTQHRVPIQGHRGSGAQPIRREGPGIRSGEPAGELAVEVVGAGGPTTREEEGLEVAVVAFGQPLAVGSRGRHRCTSIRTISLIAIPFRPGHVAVAAAAGDPARLQGRSRRRDPPPFGQQATKTSADRPIRQSRRAELPPHPHRPRRKTTYRSPRKFASEVTAWAARNAASIRYAVPSRAPTRPAFTATLSANVTA
jgi:hypothetical protein